MALPQWSNLVVRFAKAVAVAENSPPEWNNPCSLTGADRGSFQTNGVGNKEGVWKFVNNQDGWQAAYIKFDRMFRGASLIYPLLFTIAEFGLKFSGGNPNEGKNVAAALGVPETTTLQELVDKENSD